MSIETRNYSAGEWVTGQGTIENLNPSDTTDIIGAHAQADAAGGPGHHCRFALEHRLALPKCCDAPSLARMSRQVTG